MNMTEFIQRATTYPKLILGFITSASGAFAANVAPVADTAPTAASAGSGHSWVAVVAVIATASAGFATAGLAIVRAVIEWRKACREEARENRDLGPFEP